MVKVVAECISSSMADMQMFYRPSTLSFSHLLLLFFFFPLFCEGESGRGVADAGQGRRNAGTRGRVGATRMGSQA